MGDLNTVSQHERIFSHHVIPEEELARFMDEPDASGELNRRIRAMSRHQLDPELGWPRLIRNHSVYANSPQVRLKVAEVPLLLQLNKTRSASLKSSAFENTKRSCFLCELDQGQRGILIQNERNIVLANPGITIPGDLTIATVAHEKQLLHGHIPDLIQIARDLSDYSIYYNGAMAGASSPHFHFQGGLKNRLPAEQQIRDLLAGKSLPSLQLQAVIETDELTLFRIANFLCANYILRTGRAAQLERFLETFLTSLAEVDQSIRNLPNIPDFGSWIPSLGIQESEPRLNLMLQYDPVQTEYTAALFPKRFNRPSFYYQDGTQQLLLGFAIKEALGVIICCRSADFERIQKEPDLIRQVFTETSISAEMETALEEKLRKSL